MQSLNLFRAGVALASVLAASPGCAQWLGQDYATYGVPMSNFIQNSALNNAAMIAAASPSRPQAAPRAVAPADVMRNAEELAKLFPAAERGKMRDAYIGCMKGYQQIEAKMGWPASDVGGAMAAFIVGNYMVHRWSEVSDAEFAAVAEQLRREPGWQDRMRKLPPAALRKLYEQSAMVGTFMALAHKSAGSTATPDRQAKLRQIAADNLRAALGTDPTRLHISASGMRLEPR